jgi:hypothetical protein
MRRGLFAHAHGVYGYAAVPRVGLGPTAPPLCRYAVHTMRLGSECGGRTAVQDTLRRKDRVCTDAGAPTTLVRRCLH